MSGAEDERVFMIGPAFDFSSISVLARRGVCLDEFGRGGRRAVRQIKKVVVDRILAGRSSWPCSRSSSDRRTHMGGVGAGGQHLLQDFFGRA
jgi:hypothetical protein